MWRSGYSHIGAGWSDKSWCRVGLVDNGCANPIGGADFAQVDPSGFIGGVQAGYNWQINQFVLGLEGDFSFARMDGNAAFRTSYTAHTDVNDIATIAARFGFAFDRALIYGKGGVAWVNEDHWVAN